MNHTLEWEVVIGLEIHAQIASKTKLFSGAPTTFAADPNTQVSPVDAGMPGMLPVLNEECVHQAVKTGLGINACINLFSRFDRKNYFYPDLPSGYQITQFFHPVISDGFLDVDLEDGRKKRISIERIHMEQDAGKSIHDLSPDASFIDLNRAGIGLMEIVTRPDMRSSEEAMDFVRKMRLLLRYLKTSDGNMEEGSLRADINISLRRPGSPLGTRVEVKNVNSIRFIGNAIAYEVQRQKEILENGQTIKQETRLFDPATGSTRSMRSKEDSQDYRYHPEPDLPPLILTKDYVESIRKTLPELPEAKHKRFMESYDLSAYEASIIVEDLDTAHFYETAIKTLKDQKNGPKILANWMLGDLFALLNKHSLSIVQNPVSASHLSQLVDLILDGTLSGKMAKDIFLDMWEQKGDPESLISQKGLKQITDISTLKQYVQEVLLEHSSMVAQFRSGKEKVFGFLVGQIMKKSKGQGNPKIINELLHEALKG